MKIRFAIMAIAALAAFSCNKQQDRVEASFDPDEILFRAPATRATVVETSNLSTIYVTATTGTGNSEAAVSGFSAAPFTLSGGNWGGGKFWPATDPSYHFYATNVTSPALAISGGNATIQVQNANTDIVVGYIASPTFRSVNALALGHIFAQVGTVSMKAPAGYAVTNMRISLQPIVAGTYSVKNDTWTRGTAGDATYILGQQGGVTISTESSNVTYTGTDNDLWLLPGQYQLTATYTITKGAYTANMTKTCNITLVQGMNNNIGPVVQGGQDIPNIPEPDDISEIQFTVTVTPWGENHVNAEF